MQGEAVAVDDRKIRMYRDNIIVLMHYIRDARKEVKSAGGIILPNAGRKPDNDQAVEATVIASGPGTWLDKFLDWERGESHVASPVFWDNEIKAGDTVLVQRADDGDAFIVDGLEHRIVHMTNILGVLEDD